MKLKEQNGKFYKECDVYLLPLTEKKEDQILDYPFYNKPLILLNGFTKKIGVHIPDEGHRFDGSHQIMQLVVASDEEILNSNLYTNGKGVFKCDNLKDVDPKRYHYLRKIIASTDHSLDLSKPSEGFVDAFITEYNKGNVILKVLVEYIECATVKFGTGWIYEGMKLKVNSVYMKINEDPELIHQGRCLRLSLKGTKFEDKYKDTVIFEKDLDITYELKVNPKDNTITTVKEKTSYTQAEVDDLLDRQVCETTNQLLKKFEGYKSKEEFVTLIKKFFAETINDYSVWLPKHDEWVDKNI